MGIMFLRVVTGIVFIMQGQQKLFEFGVGGVNQMFASMGIPAPRLAAIVVSLVETIGGLALIVGVFMRVTALLVAGDMLVALLLVHRPKGFFVGSNGLELVLTVAAASLALVLAGPGALALDR
jgi:putative oxidoreductase